MGLPEAVVIATWFQLMSKATTSVPDTVPVMVVLPSPPPPPPQETSSAEIQTIAARALQPPENRFILSPLRKPFWRPGCLLQERHWREASETRWLSVAPSQAVWLFQIGRILRRTIIEGQEKFVFLWCITSFRRWRCGLPPERRYSRPQFRPRSFRKMSSA